MTKNNETFVCIPLTALPDNADDETVNAAILLK